MKTKVIERSQVLDLLRRIQPTLKEKYGVTKLGIFGSVARGEATESSDVDIVLEMKRPNLFIRVNIKEELEKFLDRPVDVVRYRERMNPYLKRRIDQDVIYV
ncbi:nucleotidyltransferase family protein [Leptothoe sp. LEGE 181152]|uniref:Nucleotidyltransferase n=1 Tax=Adonisia turfae CCMR0081 TaxID=2292702 RepID=A0A6M0RE25_9CYAN|nr:nucleotidyltransferase family protein [Adonisia turfae]MDV3348731.1 nucleotidyltransferase family protein [Leptothoe sp. LEGE 181152]NEZ54528.1 nucleotidyltransferase [Adonisia turfae CCMR0081]